MKDGPKVLTVTPAGDIKDNALSLLAQVIADNFYSGVGYTDMQIIDHIATTNIPDPTTWFTNQRDAGFWLPYNYEGQIFWGINTDLLPNTEPQPEEVLKPVESVPYVCSFLNLLRKGASA